MSDRLLSYQKSINKYIDEHSVIASNAYKSFFLSFFNTNTNYFPITFLTLLNSNIKKNKISSFTRYDVATCISLLSILNELLTHKVYHKKEYDIQILQLVSLINNSIIQTVVDGGNIMNNNYVNTFKCTEIVNNNIQSTINFFNTNPIVLYDKNISECDINNYKFSDDKTLSCLSKIKFIKKKFLDNYINNTYGSISFVSIRLGLLFGNSSDIDANYINIFGKNLGIMIKLSHDFNTLEDDLKKSVSDGFTMNYIINTSLQEAFNKFNDACTACSEKIIELDIGSQTITLLFKYMNELVDNAIELSSPDIRSIASSI